MYKFKVGIDADYNRQGYIYFISRAYKSLNKGQQQTIMRLCREAGGENYMALFEFVTTDSAATSICLKHYIASKTTLYRVVKKYYENFPECL